MVVEDPTSFQLVKPEEASELGAQLVSLDGGVVKREPSESVESLRQALDWTLHSAKETRSSAERLEKELEERWQQRCASLEALREAFAARQREFKVRTEEVKEAEGALRALEEEQKAAPRRRALLAKAEELLKPLVREGKAMESEEVEEQAETLLEALRSQGLACPPAVPKALRKAPASRVPSEASAVRGLEEQLARRAAALERLVQCPEEDRAARIAAVEKAQDAFDLANEKQQEGARSLWAAKAEHQKAQKHFSKARAEVATLAKQMRAASKESSASNAQRMLGAFRDGPLAFIFSSQSAQAGSKAVFVPLPAPEATCGSSDAIVHVQD